MKETGHFGNGKSERRGRNRKKKELKLLRLFVSCQNLKTPKCSFIKYKILSADMSVASYDYDLLVIGGGSGGIASAKRAASIYKAKVAGKCGASPMNMHLTLLVANWRCPEVCLLLGS